MAANRAPSFTLFMNSVAAAITAWTHFRGEAARLHTARGAVHPDLESIRMRREHRRAAVRTRR